MTGFTEQQIADLTAPLARAAVKSRKQAGREVSYLEGWHAIAEANRIFGFDGWDRETVECRCVSEKPCIIGAGGQYEKPGFRVAYVGKVRVTVRAGDRVIVREGTGYGSGIDQDVGEAHESAAKECETDALKRCLMTFGNPFGLALYDKTQAEVEPMPQRGAQRPTSARSQAPPSQPPQPREAPQAPTSAADMQREANDRFMREKLGAPVEYPSSHSEAGKPAPRQVPPATTTDMLPPNPEEPPEVERRRRIKALIDKTDAAIKAARNSIALNTMWASPETAGELAEIEAAGEAGKEAAYKLRSRFMARADQLADSESRAA